MDNHKRIPLRAYRDIYMMLGECRSLGSDGLSWRQLLVQRVRELFDADMVCLADNKKIGEPELPSDWLHPLCIVDDWRDSSNRKVFWDFLEARRAESTLLSRLIVSNKTIVARRRDFIDDTEWYESKLYREYLTKTQLDDWVSSVHHLDGDVVQVLFMQRFEGRNPFSKVALNALQTIGKDLCEWQPHPLVGCEQSVFSGLTERMRQTLSLLIAGNSTKAIAEQLGISKHTAQEHVKRLYKQVGVSSRSELCAVFSQITHRINDSHLFGNNDHYEENTNATKSPWPNAESNTCNDDS